MQGQRSSLLRMPLGLVLAAAGLMLGCVCVRSPEGQSGVWRCFAFPADACSIECSSAGGTVLRGGGALAPGVCYTLLDLAAV